MEHSGGPKYRGIGYTLGFAAAVCVVCSVVVSVSAVALHEKQAANALLDRQRQVLLVAGRIPTDEALSPEEMQSRFEQDINTRIFDLETGQYADDKVSLPYDPVEAGRDAERSIPAATNEAGIQRVPAYGAVYEVKDNGAVDMYVLPVWGQGLWSTLYGYLALDKDGTTVRGLTFYENGETPGLGGEIANPAWQAHWKGRKVFDDSGEPCIQLVKGAVGPPEEDPHRVDALSGATITSRGVESLVNFWMSEEGYGAFVKTIPQQHP